MKAVSHAVGARIAAAMHGGNGGAIVPLTKPFANGLPCGKLWQLWSGRDAAFEVPS
jgi:hypothetical protein